MGKKIIELGGYVFPNGNQSAYQPDFGMHMTDYFTAHAPEVPEWFDHIPVEIDASLMLPHDWPRPKYEQWQWYAEHGEFSPDCPEEFKKDIAEWKIKVDANWERRRQQQQQDHMARLVQWRYAYAAAMVAEKRRVEGGGK